MGAGSITERLHSAVELAVRAPSVHNTQPWRWRIDSDAVHLFADRGRQLPATDPEGRDLLLSCGAALHHLEVALSALAVACSVQYFPDPENRDHLATITVVPGAAAPVDAALAEAVLARRTDRRWFGPEPVPPDYLTLLTVRAAERGAHLHALDDATVHGQLAAALAEAARQQEATAEYAAELAMWSTRYAGARDGVPIGSVAPPLAGRDPSPLRSFPRSGLAQPKVPVGSADAGTLLLLTTPADDRRSQLRAGEAVSAVLLTATSKALATTPLSQVVERAETRRALRQVAAADDEYPQLIIRVGWPMPGAAELAATPRRPLSAVLVTP